jgi:hypothetical protein
MMADGEIAHRVGQGREGPGEDCDNESQADDEDSHAIQVLREGRTKPRFYPILVEFWYDGRPCFDGSDASRRCMNGFTD